MTNENSSMPQSHVEAGGQFCSVLVSMTLQTANFKPLLLPSKPWVNLIHDIYTSLPCTVTRRLISSFCTVYQNGDYYHRIRISMSSLTVHLLNWSGYWYLKRQAMVVFVFGIPCHQSNRRSTKTSAAKEGKWIFSRNRTRRWFVKSRLLFR